VDDVSTDSEYTSAIGKVACRELVGHGYRTYAQLTAVSEEQLLAIHGIGPKAVRILREQLAERGLAFRPD